jgi:hypothetical protein
MGESEGAKNGLSKGASQRGSKQGDPGSTLQDKINVTNLKYIPILF